MIVGMIEQAYNFQIDGKPVFGMEFGQGHINTTYLLLDSTARQYILQKVNKNVFHDPESVMKNISAVTAHLRKSAGSSREVISLIPTKDGNDWSVDGDSEYWRMYEFISDSVCIQKAEGANDFHESALAFGQFQHRLADFPVDSLTETVPNFHNTPLRYEELYAALSTDICARARNVQKEIDFAFEREEYSSTLISLYEEGLLKLRVTHNDTKLNNVLFDRTTHKALCVIDLDTVMPGFAANDFGDLIRFGASTAAEDETDPDKVNFSLPLFKSYTEGFLSACGGSLMNSEILHLPDGAKIMALECGIRFLTDYLSGDTYFGINRPDHNLDRCRAHFKLVAEMEKSWDSIQKVISDGIPR